MNVKLSRIRSLPTLYSKLMAFYPIRPIRDEIDYDNALQIVERLIEIAEPTQDQSDYLELLSEQIEKYENLRYSIPWEKENPIETLAFLLSENSMTASDLGNLLGNRQLGSKIFRRERQLSKSHIRILSRHFRVSADLFL